MLPRAVGVLLRSYILFVARGERSAAPILFLFSVNVEQVGFDLAFLCRGKVLELRHQLEECVLFGCRCIFHRKLIYGP